MTVNFYSVNFKSAKNDINMIWGTLREIIGNPKKCGNLIEYSKDNERKIRNQLLRYLKCFSPM